MDTDAVDSVRSQAAASKRSGEDGPVYDGAGVQSAMPPSLVGDYEELVAHISSQMSKDSMYDTALCVEHNVSRVPPKLPDDA